MTTELEQQILKLLDFVQLPPSMGKVFFVDPVNGAATNNGQAPNSALDTTQAAVDLCTADHNDIIIRMPGVEFAGDVALNMDCRGITLIGVDWGNPFQTYAVATGAGPPAYFRSLDPPTGVTATGPAVNVTQACTIVGMGFYGDSTIVASADPYMSAIVIDGDGGSYNAGVCHIKRCLFSGYGLAGVGICIKGSMYNLIEECTFEALTECGICLQNNVEECHINYIERNNFLGCGDAGIRTDAGAGNIFDMQVHLNRFVAKSAWAQTVAIDTGGLWAGGFITGNWFGYTRAGLQAIELNRAALEATGVYCAGNHYTDGCDPRA
jgi:hypothetical protein